MVSSPKSLKVQWTQPNIEQNKQKITIPDNKIICLVILHVAVKNGFSLFTDRVS